MKRKDSTRNAHKNRPAKGNRASGPMGNLPAAPPQWERLARHMQALALAEPTPPSSGNTTQAPPQLAAQPAGTLQQVGREADMAWAGVKRIMSLLNVENKHVYYNAASINVTQAGSVLDLCSLISQGVGGNQRVGDSLKILRVHVKAQLTANGAGAARQAITFVLGHSKDGVPAVADVFAVVSATTSGLAFPADTYQQADKWSRSRCVPLSIAQIAGTGVAGPLTELVEFDMKFGHDVLYTNASTTTASGNVWLAYISNEPTNYPTLDLAVDIEFVDN